MAFRQKLEKTFFNVVGFGCMSLSLFDAFGGANSNPQTVQKDYPSLSIEDATKVQHTGRSGDLGWGLVGLNLVLAGSRRGKKAPAP